MLKELISECTDYDFKSDLESGKPRGLLKSVSAFANGTGGALFFGVKSPDGIPGVEDIPSLSFYPVIGIAWRVDITWGPLEKGVSGSPPGKSKGLFASSFSDETAEILGAPICVSRGF